MATATIETPRTEPPTLRDRAADTVRQVTDAAVDVRHLKTLAADALEDRMHAARRTITRTVRNLEDLRDSTAGRVRKAPLTSVGLALGAGIVLGGLVAWFSKRTDGKGRGGALDLRAWGLKLVVGRSNCGHCV